MNARRGVVAVENALRICCSKAYGLYAALIAIANARASVHSEVGIGFNQGSSHGRTLISCRASNRRTSNMHSI